MQSQLNVYGNILEKCSIDPLTGWYRTGYCETEDNDYGTHVVCGRVNKDFLKFTKSRGNDLTKILKEGDFWCLCAMRWLEAYKYDNSIAPRIKLESTNIKVLQYIPLEILEKYKI